MIDVFEIAEIARRAGEEILAIYRRDFQVDYKEDLTPLTDADRASHRLILESLSMLCPEIPVLSEESSRHASHEERKDWEALWLVDPLDGTVEFVKRNGEFTVNIALIRSHAPVLGVVYAPVKRAMYWGVQGQGSFRQLEGGPVERLTGEVPRRDKFVIVASRSHMNQETMDFVEAQKRRLLGREVELISAGSSLKFCLVAEGSADLYPRLAPTMEWDVAAAHAVANGAGKKVYRYGTREELTYNKESLKNDWFLVTA